MKKTALALVILACVSLSILSSCGFSCVQGSGKIATEQRKANNFKKIDISGKFKVHLTQDSSSVIAITGDDNLLKYVITSVEGDRLIIKSKKNICNDSIVVNIGIRNLNEIRSSGAVEVSSNGKLNVSDLKIDLSGATKIDLDVNAANVATNTSGASELNLKGQAAAHHIESSGVTNVNAFDFVVGDYDISTSGASHCKINVLKTLNIHSSGASDVQYKGSPSTINNDKSGASKLQKVD